MTNQKPEQVSKRVEFKATDDERQVATGVVMVPNKVDLQGDYERPETIRNLAEGFMARLPTGDAEGGIMHAAFPDHSALVENSVLDDAREIGGKEFPAGTWTQSWKFTDNELWTLVRDEILAGYSIGADEVRWSEPMEQDDLPDDVAVSEGYPDDELAWELQSGAVKEVSAVDIPAVPDAEILQTKDATEKRIADYLGDREGFLDAMAERGHADGDAERLWNYLQRAANDDDDDDDDDVEEAAGWLARAKAFFTNGPGAPDASETPDEQTKNNTVDDAAAGGTDDGGTEATNDTDMSNDDTPPEWAKELQDSIEENSKRIEDALEAGDDADKDVDGDEGKDAFADAPEWAKALKEETEKNAQRIDDVATASGASQQLTAGGTNSSQNRKTSEAWDKTLGLPAGGDA